MVFGSKESEAKKVGQGGGRQGLKLSRGSVITLKDAEEDFFMIFVVWEDNGSKKWFPVPPEEARHWN